MKPLVQRLSEKTIVEIIKAEALIISDAALKLERPIARPAHFWNNLERRFQEDRSRLEREEAT